MSLLPAHLHRLQVRPDYQRLVLLQLLFSTLFRLFLYRVQRNLCVGDFVPQVCAFQHGFHGCAGRSLLDVQADFCFTFTWLAS